MIDTNVRYPDFLQRRLDRAGIDRPVLNAGISGNRVTLGPAIFAYGPSLMDRAADDVIGVPGVRDVILLEGINDLGIPPGTDAATVIDGLRKVILRLHAAAFASTSEPPARGNLAVRRVEHAGGQWATARGECVDSPTTPVRQCHRLRVRDARSA